MELYFEQNVNRADVVQRRANVRRIALVTSLVIKTHLPS